MKKVLMMAIVALAAVTLRAEADSWLYWMVDASSAGQFNWQYAQLYTESGTAVGGLWDESNFSGNPGYVNDGVVAGTSYYVELLNDSFDEVAKSSTLTWEVLKDYAKIGEMGKPPADQAVFTAFAAIPEPTSGLLLMLGLCGLALKRKRV